MLFEDKDISACPCTLNVQARVSSGLNGSFDDITKSVMAGPPDTLASNTKVMNDVSNGATLSVALLRLNHPGAGLKV